LRSTDEIFSIGKYLSDKFTTLSTVETARFVGAIPRPSARIILAAESSPSIGSVGYLDERNWIIWYHASSEADARVVADEIKMDLKSEKKIDAYLHDFPFLAPTMFDSTGGSLAVASYDIKITGIRGAQETNPSVVVTGVVATGKNSLVINLPKIPSSYTEFDFYRIYASVEGGTPILQATVAHSAGREYNQTYTLTSIISGGAEPPTESEVPYKTIFIREVDSEIIEDADDDGVFDARISLLTRSHGFIVSSQPSLINTVTVTHEDRLTTFDVT